MYKFLKASKGGCLSPRIKWNFTKFLVDEEGHVISRYGPSTSPKAIEVTLLYNLLSTTFVRSVFLVLMGIVTVMFQVHIKKALGVE